MIYPDHICQSTKLKVDSTLLETISILDATPQGIGILVNDSDVVLGTITDGDVRRALIQEARLDAVIEPYYNRNFLSVSAQDTRVQVLDLMQANKIKHLPVLDTKGKLAGMHLLHDIIGGSPLPNEAVIMAGGKGVRLRPITENLPKPMIPVAGRPILERLVLHLVGCGITRIHLSVNYLAEVIINHFGDGSRFGCKISYLHETEPLGTGGALSLLPKAPEHPLIVLNGDLVTQLDFTSMLSSHTASGYAATIGYRPYAHQVPFGCLEIENGSISKIREKPMLERSVNAGVYILSPEVFSLIPTEFFPITDLFQKILDRNDKVGAYEITSDWTDVGQHSELTKARGGH